MFFGILVGLYLIDRMPIYNQTQQDACYTDHRSGKLPIKLIRRFFIFFTLLSSFALTANAQFGSSGGYDFSEGAAQYSLVPGVGLDIPLGDIGTAYKASPYYTVDIIRHFNSLSFGIGGGYRMLSPKKASFPEPGNVVYIVPLDIIYNKMKSSIFYATASYNFNISDELVAFGGVNVGLYHNVFSTDGYIYGNPVFYLTTSENT